MTPTGKSVGELGRALRSRELSAHELVEKAFRDIRSLEHLGSFITLTEEAALATADERDRELAAGVDRGPFHGIPIAHKDNYYTRGIRTTAGSLLLKDFVPDFDATVVTRLHDAGAISLGKTNLHELAFGITSKNPHYGYVRNPHDRERIAGGSSGGSAAMIAAGVMPVATGTDTGGSLRIPGSYCGIVGFKPTYGLVSCRGIVPLAFSLDTAGPLGSCVEDCIAALQAMAGVGRLHPANDLKGTRVGVPRGFFARTDPEVATAIDHAVHRMTQSGAAVVEISTPDLAEINAVARVVQLAETAAIYHDRNNASEFGADVWALIQQGKEIAAHEYVNAQRLRSLLRKEFDALWQTVDVMATPATPIAAPSIASDVVAVAGSTEDIRIASTRLVRGFNLLGEPALSMPCGKTRNGLPIGLQLITRPFSDSRLLQIAAVLEQHLGQRSIL